MSVFRIYVEKKPAFAVEAKATLRDIKNSLGIALDGLRLFNRYDVEGIDEETFATAQSTIFSEPAVDVTSEELPPSKPTRGFLRWSTCRDSSTSGPILVNSASRL